MKSFISLLALILTCSLSTGSTVTISKAATGLIIVGGTNAPPPPPPSSPTWARTNLATVGSAYTTGVAFDSSGNAVVVGWFMGTVNFGSGPITSTAGSAVPNCFIAKYTDQGTLSWVKQLGGNNNDYAQAVAIDGSNNILVAGRFAGTLDFGAGNRTSSGTENGFVAKYSSTGTYAWATVVGGASSDSVNSLGVDGSGNAILVARTTSVTADYGGISVGRTGSQSIIVAKLASANGIGVWAKAWGGTGYNQPNGVAVDGSGNVAITGYFMTATDLGGGVITSTGGSDIFVAEYSGVDGSYQWGKKIGSTSSETANGITIDPATSNVIITGAFPGPLDFGGGVVNTVFGGGGLYVAAYNSSGTYLWQIVNGGGGDYGSAVAVSSTGRLALTGRTSNSLNFGGPWLGGYGSPNYFIASFDVSGNNVPTYRWYKVNDSGTVGGSVGSAVAADANGNLFSTGSFSQTLITCGFTFVTGPATTSGFVMKLNQ